MRYADLCAVKTRQASLNKYVNTAAEIYPVSPMHPRTEIANAITVRQGIVGKRVPLEDQAFGYPYDAFERSSGPTRRVGKGEKMPSPKTDISDRPTVPG